MWFGGIFLLFVFLFGGFVCFCFVFLGKKKKKPLLLVFVLLLVRTLLKCF